MAKSNIISRYEFDNFSVIPSRRLLLQNGQSIAVKPKVFDTLVILIRSRGKLLTKEELVDKIWSESFVEEGSLTQNIFALRKIFGEKPRDHQYIITMPGKGYSFVAEVREIYEQKEELIDEGENLKDEVLLERKKFQNSEIYQTYLKYRFFWETRTECGLLKSLKGAKEIVAAESNFSLGYVAVANSYLLLGHHLYFAPDKVYSAVKAAIESALELDPELAEAYSSQADYYFVTKDWERAEKTYKLSISLKTDYACARHWYGWFLTAMGKYDEAIEQIEQAQQFDPNSLYLATVRGVPFYYKRQYDRAIKQFRLILEIDPNYNRARYYLAMALFHSGEKKAGIAEFERVAATEPIQQTLALLGYCYGIAGRRSEALEILYRIERIARKRYVSPYIRAYIYLGLGETDKALTELEKALKENAIWLIWLNIDSQFEILREEPRFKKLIGKLNFPYSAV